MWEQRDENWKQGPSFYFFWNMLTGLRLNLGKTSGKCWQSSFRNKSNGHEVILPWLNLQFILVSQKPCLQILGRLGRGNSSGVTGGGAGEHSAPLAAFTGLAKQSYRAGEDIEDWGRKKGRRQKKKREEGKKNERGMKEKPCNSEYGALGSHPQW